AAAGERTPALRRLIANVILILGIFGLILWGLVLTSAILPPWPVLAALSILAAIVAALMYRSLIRVHARAQVRLAEPLSDPPVATPTNETVPITLPDLQGAQLRIIQLAPGTVAAGKLIRELSIRSTTGASVVAIDRDHTPIISPGPDEEL